MYTAKIVTISGDIDVNIADASSFSEASTYINKMIDGELLEGQASDLCISQINRNYIVYIRIFNNADNTPVAPETIRETPAPIMVEGCTHFADIVEYLGQNIRLYILEYRKPSVTLHYTSHYLVYTVNGEPWFETMSDHSLTQMVNQWVMQKRKNPAYTLVIPPAYTSMTLEETEAFLVDYVKEDNPKYVPKDKNANAFFGWRDKE